MVTQKPKPKLQNYIKNLVSQTWSIAEEEELNSNGWSKQKMQTSEDDVKKADPSQVWWTDQLNRGKSQVKLQSTLRQYYRLWQSFDAPLWTGPVMPSTLGEEEKKVGYKEAKALPECFYKKLPVITPENVDDFVRHLRDGF